MQIDNANQTSKNANHKIWIKRQKMQTTKKHPNKTADMDEAILVFEKWMLDYKKSKFLV